MGVIVALLLGEVVQSFVTYFLPIAAGGFIYVAIADLMPELHKTKNIKYSMLQLTAVIVGILAMIFLTLLE